MQTVINCLSTKYSSIILCRCRAIVQNVAAGLVGCPAYWWNTLLELDLLNLVLSQVKQASFASYLLVANPAGAQINANGTAVPGRVFEARLGTLL
jgi:hypothetical protein